MRRPTKPTASIPAAGKGETPAGSAPLSGSGFPTILALFLFASIGGNLYLGWLARDFYWRYRDLAWEMLTAIPGVSCVKPKGAIYLFPQLDPKVQKISSDDKFVLDFLLEEKVLLVKGSGFNIDDTQHFRVVFLPHKEVLADAITRLGRFLSHYRQD